MNEPQSLGQRIKYARRALGMSQKQLADMIHVSDKTVSSYEVGRAMPPVDTLKEISIATSRPIGYFVTETTKSEENPVELKLAAIERDLAKIKDMIEMLGTKLR